MSRYLIEISQQITTPVIVEADSPQEAREAVLVQQGNTGDPSYSEPHIERITLMEG